jgi:hypothetical protein
VRPHKDVALDQLRNADNHASTPEQQHAGFLTAAIVHAILDVGDAMRCEPDTDHLWDLITGDQPT